MNDTEISPMLVRFSDNDTQQKELERLWGSRVPKLSPKQTQMVVEILQEWEELKRRKYHLAWN